MVEGLSSRKHYEKMDIQRKIYRKLKNIFNNGNKPPQRQSIKSSIKSNKEIVTIQVGNREFSIKGKRYGTEIRESSDYALYGLAALSMTHNLDIHLDGVVTSDTYSRISKLGELWQSWSVPGIFPLGITVSEIIKPKNVERAGGIFCLSGGVDSSYAGIGAAEDGYTHALLIAGADYSSEQSIGFQQLKDRVSKISRYLNLELVIAETDIRSLRIHWGYFHTLLLAMCLSYSGSGLGFGGFSADNTIAQDYERHPWGNNHAVAAALGSKDFPINYRGGDRKRSEKVGYIYKYMKEIVPYISVCNKDTTIGGNCGTCWKCVDTKLNFIANGIDYTPFFEKEINIIDFLERGVEIPEKGNAIRKELMRKYDSYFLIQDGDVKKALSKYITRLERLLRKKMKYNKNYKYRKTPITF